MLDIRDVQEQILVTMFLVYGRHQCSCGRENLVDEDEDSLFGRELDALANDIDELANGEVGRNQVFLLVDGCDVGLFDFLADHLRCENMS